MFTNTLESQQLRQSRSPNQSAGTNRLGNERLNQQRQQNLKKARAAGGLASQLAANPLSQQVAQSPLRQAMQQRRTQSIAGLQGAQRDMAGPMTSGPIGTVDPGLRNQAMRFTLQPQMNGGDAIDAAYARRAAASAAKPTARIGLGSDGQRMVAQGTPLSRMFPSASDEGNRAKFEAARDARVERKAEARAMRQDQLAQQRQAAMSQQNQTPVINPFMNPIAMTAMRRDPTLALGAVNSLNEAIQGRGRLQTERGATVADTGLRARAQSLQEAIGTGRLALELQGQQANNTYRDRALDAETGFRNQQASAAQRSADASYLTAEANAERQRAEAALLGDPAVRQRQEQMDLFEMASGSPDPMLQRQARDIFEALNMQRSGDNSQQSSAPSVFDNQSMIESTSPLFQSVFGDPISGLAPADIGMDLLEREGNTALSDQDLQAIGQTMAAQAGLDPQFSRPEDGLFRREDDVAAQQQIYDAAMAGQLNQEVLEEARKQRLQTRANNRAQYEQRQPPSLLGRILQGIGQAGTVGF